MNRPQDPGVCLTDEDSAIFEAMFELAPVSLWLKDYSGLKQLFDEWRAQGVTDFRAHVAGHAERIVECSRRLRVVKVNRRTLELYCARDLTELVDNLARVFRDEMFHQHLEELVQLWDNGDSSPKTISPKSMKRICVRHAPRV